MKTTNVVYHKRNLRVNMEKGKVIVVRREGVAPHAEVDMKWVITEVLSFFHSSKRNKIF